MQNSSTMTGRMIVADWLPRIDFYLDAPANQVWPLLLHWHRWIDTYRSESVSGQPDQVGEVKKVTKLDENGGVAGTFSIQIVRLTPNERLVYKILPFKEAPFGIESARGYELFNVYEMDGRTLVTYETVAEMETSVLTAAEFDVHVGQGAHKEVVREWTEKYVPALRELLKTQAIDGS